MSLEVRLLNHASVQIRWGDHALVTDPWYVGECFARGWQLRTDNPNAYDDAAASTHLWISHFHADHFHRPTLRGLARRAPDLTVLTNPCPHFDDVAALTNLGFHRFHPVPTRQRTQIASDFELIRFPVSGIDNTLLLRAGPWTILNYNDCNLPRSALQRLLRHIGPVDVLLVNFNHAGRLLGEESDEEIREGLIRGFAAKRKLVGARWVVPFASFHGYRSKYSFEQNGSMIEPEELENPGDVVPLHPGDSVRFGEGTSPDVSRGGLSSEPAVELHYGPSRDAEELLGAVRRLGHRVRRAFLGVSRWIPPLDLWIEDLDRMLCMDVRRGSRWTDAGRDAAHIETHSQAVWNWATADYGSISFQVGAHYRCLTSERRALERTLLACGLADNCLDPRSLLHDLGRGVAIPFLWHRREEIGAVLGQRRFGIESRF